MCHRHVMLKKSARLRRTLLRVIDVMNELASTDEPHRRDEPNLQNATIIRDYTGRVRPGYWVLVCPGSERTWKLHMWETESPKGRWGRKALQFLDVNSGSGLPHFTATTTFEQGSLKTKGVTINIHFNASDESVRIFCNLQTDRVGEPLVHALRHQGHGRFARGGPRHCERKQLSEQSRSIGSGFPRRAKLHAERKGRGVVRARPPSPKRTGAGRNAVLTSSDKTHGSKANLLLLKSYSSQRRLSSSTRNWTLVTPCGKFTKSKFQGDAQRIRRTGPNSKVFTELNTFVPSTADSTLTVWVTACLDKQLLRRQKNCWHNRQDETIEASSRTTPSTQMFFLGAGRGEPFAECRENNMRSGRQHIFVQMTPCSRHTNSG